MFALVYRDGRSTIALRDALAVDVAVEAIPLVDLNVARVSQENGGASTLWSIRAWRAQRAAA